MKDVSMPALPACDLCMTELGLRHVKDAPRAHYDVPLKPRGTWGYACEDHYARHGSMVTEAVGYRLTVACQHDDEAARIGHGEGMRIVWQCRACGRIAERQTDEA